MPSPCFVVDRAPLQYNLDILAEVASDTPVKILAALKAFSFHALFDQIGGSLSGACASGVHEARLARETIGKEVHVYAPAYKDAELYELFDTADHIVFNNLRQWLRFRTRCLSARDAQARYREKTGRAQLSFGIRINPEYSEQKIALYDPCAPSSRLGITRPQWDRELAEVRHGRPPKTSEEMLRGISGIHFHTLCEQGAEPLERTLAAVESKWDDVLSLPQIEWLNMGGGHHITKPGYRRDLLKTIVRRAARKWNLEVYLEPGEAVCIHTGVLVASVVDIHENAEPIAVLDVSATCHMPDILEMPYTPEVWGAVPANGNTVNEYAEDTDRTGRTAGNGWSCVLAGPSCLAGDVIGRYVFDKPLSVGSRIVFDDMAHYTMVKTTTFNGVPLPSLAVYDSRTGNGRVIRSFGYEDFKGRLS